MKNKEKGQLFFSMTYEFLEEYMPNRLGRSKATVKSYRDALTVFRRYLYEEKGISVAKFRMADCTKDLLLEFMGFLKSKGYTEGTCNQRAAAVKSYIWFVADKDVTVQSVALAVSKVPQLKGPKKEKEVLSDEALSAMLRQPPNTKTGIRDRTIMVLLYDTAVRLDEILSLRLGDVNLTGDMPYIRVHGKGNKERTVAVSEKTVSHLRNYIATCHPKQNKGDFLFYTRHKGETGKMSESNAERFIRKYASEVRESEVLIPENVYPHMFRRTRATNLYQQGVELEMVSQILGHSTTETTKIYAKPSLDQMRKALESVETPAQDAEPPLWEQDSEEKMARLCGLR